MFHQHVLSVISDAVPTAEDLRGVPGLLDLRQPREGLLAPKPVLPVRHSELGLAEVGPLSSL